MIYKMRKILFLAALLPLLLVACNDELLPGGEPDVYPTNVILEAETMTLRVGTSGNLAATIIPNDATLRDKIWQSSDTSVATVNALGTISALSTGTTTITVTTVSGGHSSSALIIVKNEHIAVSGVEIEGCRIETLQVGSTHQLTAVVSPANASIPAVIWTSNNEDVAIVNAQGLVRGIGSGAATITATSADGNKTATSEINVAGIPGIGEPTAVLDPGVFIGEVDERPIRWATRNVDMPGTFAASPESAGMMYQWGKNVGWSSSNPLINSNGSSVWDNSSFTGTEWLRENDPCPPGWRVPVQAEMQALSATVQPGLVWVNNVAGRRFGVSPNTLFLPAAGRRVGGGGLDRVGNGGNYWVNTQANSSAMARALWYCAASSGVSPSGQWRHYAFTIRCVQE